MIFRVLIRLPASFVFSAALFLISALFFLSFSFVSAQGLLPSCVKSSTPDCTVCDLLKTGENVINFLIKIAIPIGVIVILIGAVMILISAGSEARVAAGRKILNSAVIGIIIVLAGWLVIDTVLTFFADPKVIPKAWYKIECRVEKPTFAAPPVAPPAPPVGLVPIPAGIPVKANACKGSPPCQVGTALAEDLKSLNTALTTQGINWQVTEAYPPTINHKNPCHQNGTCIDANFTGGTQPTATNINTFIRASTSSGLKAVYEVPTATQKDSLVKAGVPESSIQVVKEINAPHFSVYNV